MEQRQATVQETEQYIRRMLRDGRKADYIEDTLSTRYEMDSAWKTRIQVVPANVKIEDVKIDTIYSQTGYARGSGSAPYRWVAGLTSDEREAVKAGHLVLVENTLTNSCDWYEVTYRGGKYGHRIPVRADLIG